VLVVARKTLSNLQRRGPCPIKTEAKIPHFLFWHSLKQ
jgi:hypothetical protein